MSTTTMHFGPEWMRTKHQPSSRPQPPSPPPPASVPSSGASTYSALVSPAPPPQPDKRDEAHPFRYSKEEMLRIYREGGGKGGLGLEVERWEGVVREVGSEPIGLREMGDAEKKLFAGSLNSELRRRQSTDYLSPLSTQSLGTERPRLNHSASATSASPLRERFGTLLGRRRDGSDAPPPTMPRRLSLSTGQGPLTSPRDTSLPSPRTRIGISPSFDGVLGGGESWVARRRASEGLLKAAGGISRDPGGDYLPDAKGSDIREEDEGGSHDAEQKVNIQDGTSAHQPSPSPQPNPSPSGGALGGLTLPDSQLVNMSLSDDTSLTDRGQSAVGSADVTAMGISSTVGPPPGLLDLASVEWSYLDPQGQVQGPFRADLMQKWYDDGYFAQDLLMKRTHVDTEWLPVGELARRSAGEKIFLSLPVPSIPPPGLSRRTDSPLQGFSLSADQNPLNGPYQPAPVRNLRSSTLDSYLGTGSNPSDSPSSSFGGGRFGNGSPDPAAFGGRAVNSTYGTGDGRGSNFSTASDPPAAFPGVLRNTFTDPLSDPSMGLRSPSFGNLPGRGSTVDNYQFNGAYSPTQAPWQASPSNPIGSGFDGLNAGRGSADSMPYSSNFGTGSNLGSVLNRAPSFGNLHGSHDIAFGDGGSGNTAFPGSDYSSMDKLSSQQHLGRSMAEEKNHTNFNNYNGGGTAFGGPSQVQQYPQSPSTQYVNSQQHHQPASPLSNVFGHPGTAPNSIPRPQLANQNNNIPAVPQSPWNIIPESSSVRRPGPFDPAHPKTTNTMPDRPITPPQPSPWGGTSQPSRSGSQTNEPSPWFAASQAVPDENWKEAPGPSSLTFSNLGQHNQQQQQLAAPVDVSANTPEVSGQLQQPQVPPEPAPLPESKPVAIPTPIPAAPKSRSKQKQIPTTTPASIPQQNTKSPSPPPAAQAKPAWSSEDEPKKPKPSGISLSLRDIQEAEAKKSEARKTAERERERTARASVVPIATTDEGQPFTTSWGLPTSQAGARTSATQKEPSTSNSSSPVVSTPVWTTSAKPQTTKKTMKEIQEEEERRKKFAAKETTASAAARRAYAESTNKVSPVVQGSAWTTVGPSGKTAAPLTPSVRPPITPSTSTLGVPGSPATPRTNGTAVPRPAAPPAVVKAAPATARVDDFPAPPSHDFLRWLGDSLKGLNSSVNVEEIISMLLSFPMDPDPSTAEIISDLIYANSTTLDGRRFAAEFINRRKADATSRPKGAGVASATTGKPISIADVVKAQPKPTQPEWGGFKVVNKKKKGGRT